MDNIALLSAADVEILNYGASNLNMKKLGKFELTLQKEVLKNQQAKTMSGGGLDGNDAKAVN